MLIIELGVEVGKGVGLSSLYLEKENKKGKHDKQLFWEGRWFCSFFFFSFFFLSVSWTVTWTKVVHKLTYIVQAIQWL